MDIRVLQYFLAVVQEGTVSKAARVMGTTQPNLSRQLNTLEEELDCKLFDRGSRKITLTEEGIFLYRRAKEIVQLARRTESDLDQIRGKASGIVHIGGIETPAIKALGKPMASLYKKYPQIQYDFFSGRIKEITNRLNHGLLDFGIVTAPYHLANYDYLQLPKKDTFGFLVHRDCPLAGLACVCPSDLKNYPLWVFGQPPESQILSDWLGKDIKNLNVISSFGHILTPAQLVEEGIGIAFAAKGLVSTGPNSSLCFRPLEPQIDIPVYLIWKKHQILTRAAEFFLKEVRRILPQ